LPTASLALALDDEVQYRCAGYIQAEIERYADALEDETVAEETRQDEDGDSEDNDDNDEEVNDEDDKRAKARSVKKKKLKEGAMNVLSSCLTY